MNAQDIRTLAATLRERWPRQKLAPRAPWDPALSERILDADLPSGAYALSLKAGLLLWNDDLQESHAVSQQIETETGSLWHGIMHRMEGDYSNAKFWFRRTGKHPVFAALANRASAIIGEYSKEAAKIARNGSWDPYAFTDCVEQALHNVDQGLSQSSYLNDLEQIQQAELEELLSYCFQHVFGGTLFDSYDR